MSGDTPTLSSEIARVVRLGYTADEYAEATDAEHGPDAVSDDAGGLGDALRQTGARIRWMVDVLEAKHLAEVKRLTHEHSQDVLGLQSNAAAVKVQHDARVERAHADRLTATSFAGECKGELIVANLDIERLTRARAQDRRYVDKANEDAIAGTQLAIDAQAEAARLQGRITEILGWATRAHPSADWSTYAVLEGLLSRLRSLYPGDSTTDGPAPAEPGNPEVAWSALRIAAARLGSVTVRGVDVDLHAAVDMALGEVRGEPGGDQ